MSVNAHCNTQHAIGRLQRRAAARSRHRCVDADEQPLQLSARAARRFTFLQRQSTSSVVQRPSTPPKNDDRSIAIVATCDQSMVNAPSSTTTANRLEQIRNSSCDHRRRRRRLRRRADDKNARRSYQGTTMIRRVDTTSRVLCATASWEAAR